MHIASTAPVAAEPGAIVSRWAFPCAASAATRCAVRTVIALLLLAGLAVPLLSGEQETRDSLLAGKLFSDRTLRTERAIGSYASLYVYFCGHCPRAGEHMRGDVKQMHDQIEKERLPIQIICITPDSAPGALEAWKKELDLPFVWAAKDVTNSRQIDTRHIFDTFLFTGDGTVAATEIIYADLLKRVKGKGRFRYSSTGLTDEKVKSLWWMFERGRAGAGAALTQGLASPAKAECETLLAALRVRRDALISATASIHAYDDLEQLAVEWQGVPAAELTPVQKRMQELDKEKTLADELIARRAWKTIQGLITGNDTQYKQGVAGLDELAKKYPATYYGKEAAQCAKALATKPSAAGARP